MININDIYATSDGKEFRVLWFSPKADTVFVIELTDNNMPVRLSFAELQIQLQNGEVQICVDDPYLNKAGEHLISDKDKSQRESAWSVIKPLVEDEPDIYDRFLRGKMVLEICKDSGISKMSVYRYLKKYWLRGKNKNALLPRFQNCGSKGKERNAVGKKKGRPRKYDDSVGKNVDDETKWIFEQAIGKYYHTRQEYSFKAAYELMVKDFYTKPAELPDGSIRYELLAADEIPTLCQFRYWYSKMYDHKEKIIARKGQKQYDLNHRDRKSVV